MPSSACSDPHPPPHSFPPRRSSDLSRPDIVRKMRDLSIGVITAQSGLLQTLQIVQGLVGKNNRRRGRRRCFSRFIRGGTCSNFCHRRSEEHTSELQSRRDLVCRLLLAPTPIRLLTLSLHDALPIYRGPILSERCATSR